jgi:hypothetical protein
VIRYLLVALAATLNMPSYSGARLYHRSLKEVSGIGRKPL